MREAEKEAKRQQLEAERLAREAAKEEERLAKEAERLACLQRLEEQKKKRSIFNFGVASEGPASKSPRRGGEEAVGCGVEGEGTASPAKVAYLRGGRRIVPFYLPRDATLAASLTSRPPSCAEAPAYLARLINFLGASREGAAQEGGLGSGVAQQGAARAAPPTPPQALVMSARRERVLSPKVLSGSAPWQYANMKTLAFHEDVRPAYHGTFTHASPSLAENAKAAHEASLLEIGASAEGWIDAPDAPGDGAGPACAAMGVSMAEPPPKLSAAAVGRIFGSAFAVDDDIDDGSRGPRSSMALSSVGGGLAAAEQCGGAENKARSLASLGNGSVSRRRPFGKDTSLFDYDNDSEAGWEEEGEGEELGSEIDDAEAAGDEGAMSDEEDDFFVNDVDESGEAGSKTSAKSGKLQPSILVGSLLSGGLATPPELRACAAVCLDGLPQPGDDAPMSPTFAEARATAPPAAGPAVWPTARPAASLNAAIEGATANATADPTARAAPAPRPVTDDNWLIHDTMDTESGGGGGRGGATRGAVKRSVTAEELPRLVQLVHGSTYGMGKMVASFLDAVPPGTVAASKAQVKAQITALATYGKRSAGLPGLCWQVSAEKLAAACTELGASPIELPSLTLAQAPAPPKADAPPAAPVSSSSSSREAADGGGGCVTSETYSTADAAAASSSPVAPPTAPAGVVKGGNGMGGKKTSPSKRSSPSKKASPPVGGGISKPQPSLKAFFLKKPPPATPQTVPGTGSGGVGSNAAGASSVTVGGQTVTPQTEEERKEGGERVPLDAPVPMVG